MSFDPQHIEISVVAPCYNEEQNIGDFLCQLHDVMVENQIAYEVIIVDDGSVDESRKTLIHFADCFPLNPVFLTRNFGQQAALLAGIHKANGKAIVTIDLDLQQPPELISQLVDQWRDGAKVVHAIPIYRNSASWHKRLTSKLFYKFLRILGSESIYKANDFRLFDREVANIIKHLPEKNLYLRGLFPWIGLRQDIMEYVHQPRHKGETKYSYVKMINLALKAVANQTTTPLRIGLLIGLLSIGLAFVLMIWALVVHFIYKQTVAGWTSLVIVLLFFSSINFLVLGIIGEYVGQIFVEVKNRPPYIVARDSKGTRQGTSDQIKNISFNSERSSIISSNS